MPVLLYFYLEPPQAGQNEKAQYQAGEAESNLAASKAKAEHRHEPKCGRGGDADEHVASPQDRAGANETHS